MDLAERLTIFIKNVVAEYRIDHELTTEIDWEFYNDFDLCFEAVKVAGNSRKFTVLVKLSKDNEHMATVTGGDYYLTYKGPVSINPLVIENTVQKLLHLMGQ